MPLQTYEEFLPTLIAARQAKGMRQHDVADQLGLNQSTVALWESHLRLPSQENAERWAALLDVKLPAHATLWFSRRTRAKEPRHGTRNGYQWHQTHNDMPACGPCLKASAEYAAERRRLGIA